MSSKYYLNISIDEVMNASSKAVNDCNSILKSLGFDPFTLNIRKDCNPFLKKVLNGLEFMKLLRLKKNSTLVIPHPIYINKKYIDFLKKAKLKNNLKLVFLIHDIDSLRKIFIDALDDFNYIDKTMYEISDAIIAHNEKMINYLEENGVSRKKVVNLKIFDYLAPKAEKEISFSKTLNIAGNLDVNKSGYIKELVSIDKSVKFNLYGVNFDNSLLKSESINYKGAFLPDEVPLQLNEGFGLVWDGQSINTCSGNTGEYLRYNNPHKLSLYLASGLPVIIWAQAAEAKFVVENKLGYAVNSINDVTSIFKSLDEQQYSEIKSNVLKISSKLQDGYFLKEAIKKVEKII